MVQFSPFVNFNTVRSKAAHQQAIKDKESRHVNANIDEFHSYTKYITQP